MVGWCRQPSGWPFFVAVGSTCISPPPFLYSVVVFSIHRRNTVNTAIKQKEFLTQNEVIAELRISRQTFFKMRKNGEFIKPVIKSPMRWRVSDIDNFFNINVQGETL
jgi:predicted DNA-binding transcriptional regulator AlpA